MTVAIISKVAERFAGIEYDRTNGCCSDDDDRASQLRWARFVVFRESDMQLRRSRLHLETLSARLLMAADTVAHADASGEPEDYIVQSVGSIAFVIGTDVDDTISLVLGEEQHQLTINGSDHQFDPAVIDQIVISGMSSDNDQVTIVPTSDDARVEILDDELEIITEHYAVRVQQSESVTVNELGGPQDSLRIYDSAGDDTVFLDPSFTSYTNSHGETYVVRGAERTEAYADKGGTDQALFLDSVADDRFVGRHEFSYLEGDGFSNYARGFEEVDARHQAGGNDEARLFGSDADDRVTARPNLVVMEADIAGNTTTITASFFNTTRSFAGEGNDVATLIGQDLVSDRFVWTPESSYLYTTGIEDLGDSERPPIFTPSVASNVAVGFDTVHAVGSDDSDRAELMGSEEADQLVGLPEVVMLATPSATVNAQDFRIVRSFGLGGANEAYLEDSPDNDTFISNESFAYLEGTDYLNYVADFELQVHAKNGGGDDYANPQDYRGPDQDFLVFNDTEFFIFGPERRERIAGFDRARGDAIDAGWVILASIQNPFILGGSHDRTQNPTDEQTEELVAWSNTELPNYEIVESEVDGVTVLSVQETLGEAT